MWTPFSKGKMKARGRGVPRSLDRNGDKERLKDTLSGREGDRALSLTHAHFVFRISLCRQEDPGCVVYNAPSSIIHFQTDDHTLSRSQCSGVSRKRACGAADVMLELPRDAVRAWLTFRMYNSSRICVGRNSQPNPEAPTFLSRSPH